MPVQWLKTTFPGVRCYRHKTRKHGIHPDLYFAIRFQANGKRHEEGLGWASEGWSAKRAAEELARLKRAARLGEGPRTLREARAIELERIRKEQEELEVSRLAAITFSEFFGQKYFPHAQAHKKSDTWSSEERLFRLWIAPVIGSLQFADIAPFHLDKIKSNMRAGRRADTAPVKSQRRPLAPKTINDALALIRQVWNFARREKIVDGDWPGRDIKKLKVSNERIRFLSREEAARLMRELKSISRQLHDIALISLHCGARAGEVFSLTWGCVDFERETLLLVDTKNGTTRAAFMTPAIKAMLQERKAVVPSDQRLIFTNRLGHQIDGVSAAFARLVKRLGFNDGVEDSRRKVCFHTLRHTYASWMVEAGVDLYTVKELLGHKTLAMTARYSHLGENSLRQATRILAATMDKEPPSSSQVPLQRVR